jgi:hypothetical protein
MGELQRRSGSVATSERDKVHISMPLVPADRQGAYREH